MGRTKLIETPEKMWELFESYREDTKGNPRAEEVFGGKDFDRQSKRLERPLTLSGFDCYVFALEGIESKGVLHYFTNHSKLYDDYTAICSRIKNIIRTDQIEGGMVGQYNASITQRLNNLTDKTEVTQKVEQPLFGNTGDDD